MYYLYHIHRPHHTIYEGYIGITSDTERRWKQHLTQASNPHLKYALAKYKDIKMTVLMKADTEACLLGEELLRPKDKIGWNVVKGGGKPPCASNWSANTRKRVSEKRKGLNNYNSLKADIFCYQTGIMLASEICISEWSKQNKYDFSHLMKTARGERNHHKNIFAVYCD